MTDDERKELTSQRHDFIKEYYKMAASDLDRHLKGGWQTIAVLAGGAAILTAGHDGKVALPLAVVLAEITAFWGALTVVDANYWSLRAIAFLSNVEAVYFTVEDRKNFNPYAGRHPPYGLLDSLKYLFWLCICFAAICVLDAVWEVSKAYSSAAALVGKIHSLSAAMFGFWSLPFLVFICGVFVVQIVSVTRLKSYVVFSTASPGPGMRTNLSEFRDVLFQPSTVAAEADPQSRSLTITRTALKAAKFWRGVWCVVLIAVFIVVVVVTSVKLFGCTWMPAALTGICKL